MFCATMPVASMSGAAGAVKISLEMMAVDVVGLLDALDIEQAYLRRLDGGMIAQTVALDHPDRVASIALVNTTSEYSDDQLQAWRDRAALVLRDGMEAVREPLLARWLTADAARRRRSPRLRLAGGNDRPLAASFDGKCRHAVPNTMPRLPECRRCPS